MVSLFPHLNAFFNLSSFFCLLSGYRAIRRGDVRRHRAWMLSALAFSAGFFASYTVYHILHGPVHYEGRFPGLYFPVLFTHTPLATLVLPLAGLALWFAHHGQFHRHRAVTRWLFPIWLYVSLTGVLLYLLLYHLP